MKGVLPCVYSVGCGEHHQRFLVFGMNGLHMRQLVVGKAKSQSLDSRTDAAATVAPDYHDVAHLQDVHRERNHRQAVQITTT